jgi:catechol 2,3-dioxygenase-like lactoylglutathione lyase family enzyme
MKLESIKETCIYVNNLEASKIFYHEILGLELISFVENRHLFFRIGHQVLLCFNPETTKAETSLPPHFAYGKQHIAFEVQFEEYQNWKEKLVGAGIKMTHEHEWKKKLLSFYFEDPDGNVLEIVQPGIWD